MKKIFFAYVCVFVMGLAFSASAESMITVAGTVKASGQMIELQAGSAVIQVPHSYYQKPIQVGQKIEIEMPTSKFEELLNASKMLAKR